MATAAMTDRGYAILKWCYHCNFYHWTERQGSRFVCHNCDQPVEDWLTRLLYR
jgi:hypothetical protein